MTSPPGTSSAGEKLSRSHWNSHSSVVGAKRFRPEPPNATSSALQQKGLSDTEGVSRLPESARNLSSADSGRSLRRSTTRVTTTGERIIRLAGVDFEVEREGGVVYLRHRRWSLVGHGSSLPEAMKDLLLEARELRDALVRVPASRLDEQATSLLSFVLRV